LCCRMSSFVLCAVVGGNYSSGLARGVSTIMIRRLVRAEGQSLSRRVAGRVEVRFNRLPDSLSSPPLKKERKAYT
jgi:hypothetical protein